MLAWAFAWPASISRSTSADCSTCPFSSCRSAARAACLLLECPDPFSRPADVFADRRVVLFAVHQLDLDAVDLLGQFRFDPGVRCDGGFDGRKLRLERGNGLSSAPPLHAPGP